MRRQALRGAATSHGTRNTRSHDNIAASFMARLLAVLCTAGMGVTVESMPLTLEEAVALAVSRADPTLIRHDERARAMDNQAVAAAQNAGPRGVVRFR